MINEPPDVRPKGRYSISETAKILQISVTTVYRYLKNGVIKNMIRANGRVAITGSEITRFWGGEYL
jgi:predicted site-specific integrase-resolvase